MAKKISKVDKKASTDEGREQQLIALAINEAERRLLDGTASPAIIVHYLKLGSSNNKIDQDLSKAQLKKLNAQTEMYESTKHIEQLYADAMSAFSDYRGKPRDMDDEDGY